MFGQIFGLFGFLFFVFFGFFVFFPESFGNSRKRLVFHKFSNAVNSFRIAFGKGAVRRPIWACCIETDVE